MVENDYESFQRKRNIIVGAFILVAAIALFWMVFKFGEMPLFVSKIKSYEVRVQFPSAPGVQPNTQVRFCGYNVGRVTEVVPPKMLKDPRDGKFYYQSIVVLSIDKKYGQIPVDVDVKLMTRGLGSSYIELKSGPYDVNTPYRDFLPVEEGKYLQGSTGVASEFFPEESQQKLTKLVDAMENLLGSANAIIGDEENQKNLQRTIENLAKATEQATTTLANADAHMEDITVSFVQTSDNLAETLKELHIVLEKVNEGKGSMAKLLNDGRLYENLIENTEQIEKLLDELRLLVERSRKKGIPLKIKY